ncbi:MAG: GntR family transcriptional regulator, N-acetylglucosamine utilization regulator [Chloroflexota bacterium]|nr:GntR family transcriptional regulator, N-acetylglucosamine utilization regulator [Chloroflexota bacterium]
MSSMIDPANIVPKYYQLANILREKILNGEFSAQDAIPSERQLEEQYNLSRPTIRQAIDLLERQGYLYRVHGKGTFVSPPKLQKGMLELTSFSEDMRNRGLEPGQRILEYGLVAPSAKIARQLGLNDSQTQVLRIKRLRTGSGDPIGLQDSYLALEANQSITREEIEARGSIYAILEQKYGIYPTEADETLEVTLATPEEAELLQIPEGSPLLLNERTLWSQDRKAIEFVSILYRGDRYKYFVRLTRKW